MATLQKAHRPLGLDSPMPPRIAKRRRLISASLHSQSFSHIRSRSTSPVSQFFPISTLRSVTPMSPSPWSPRLLSPTSFRSVSPGSVSSENSNPVESRGVGRGGRAVRGRGRGRGGHAVRGRGRGVSEPSVVIGRGRGRGRRNPRSSAESSTWRPPPPYRPSSKNIPPVIRYEARHPFTEEVGPTQPLPQSATALDFFMQMFDEDLMQHIVTQTNLFATMREGHCETWNDLPVPEFQGFLGTMILMGIHLLPSIESYWSTDELLGAPNVVGSFTRDRFANILRELHLMTIPLL